MVKNKSVFITGSNRGIGKKMIETFAENGAGLIIAHARKRNKEFEEYLKEIEAIYNVKTIAVYFDMINYEEMKECIKNIQKQKISIDVLVNNAGVAHGGLFQMTSMSKIKEIFEVNFFAALELTQMVLKNMKKNGGGSIINIASISGLDLKVGNCAYGTSKAAIIAFTKTLASEVATYNIRINAIAPGLTDTDMSKLMEANAGKAMVRDTAMNRLGKTKEIADVTVFLASEKASFITGQVLRVDGGTI